MPLTTRLDDRAVIAVTGPDALPFLNGLLTQEVETLAPGELRYGAFLTPQGRLLFDLFLFGTDDGVRLDVAAGTRDALLARLSLHRLRAKVDLQPLTEAVWASWDSDPPPDTDPPPPGEVARSAGGGFTLAAGHEAPPPGSAGSPPEGGASASWRPDPRIPALGWRAIGGEHSATTDADAYDAHRVGLGVPDVLRDGLSDRAYAVEADLDLLNGVDFKKGCFVGQETTSRMKRRGVIKTRLLPLIVEGATAGAEVLAGDLRAGELTYARADRALALLRLDRIESAALTVDGRPARVDPPAWYPQPPTT